MTLPVQSQKRRLPWFIAIGVLMFAAGLATGLLVHDKVFTLVNKSGPEERRVTSPGAPSGAGSEVALAPSASGAKPIVPTVAPLAPSPAPAPTPALAERATSGRGRARTGGKAASSPKAAGLAEEPAKKSDKDRDPFDLGTARKSKAPVEVTPARRASKSAGGGDSLDDLMAGVMTDSKSKSKKDKSIDDMLKDVQKSQPSSASKREETAKAEPLSPADIAKGMAQVKTKAKSCAQSTGKSGIAQIKISVGKSGKVTAATVSGKIAGSSLAACIERAARSAVFRPNTGLTFDYRVDAR